MLDAAPLSIDASRQIAIAWLASFEQALVAGEARRIAEHFADDSHWRDVVAFTWTIRPFAGRGRIARALARLRRKTRARTFRLADERPAPRFAVRLDREVVEAVFTFETEAGAGAGVVRLLPPGPDRPTAQAWVLMTSLECLNAAAPPARSAPDILVVGAGQAGLSLAARLQAMGASYLAIEKLPRIGDVWRRRYAALKLHNPTPANHLPYLRFPADWPRFLPKDMLADWLERYARELDLNVETRSTLVSAAYDATARRWTAEIEGPAGRRTLRPRHLVFASGAASTPIVPDLPDLAAFRGAVMHTDRYSDGRGWRGKRALVLGSGNSGHDVAEDLHRHGCQTTLIQRGATTVVSVEPSDRLTWAAYEDAELQDADLLSLASVYPLAVEGARRAARHMARLDREMIEGLRARGFKFDLGADETGHLMKNRRRNGGYYLDTGCAKLIIDGEIALLDYAAIDRFVGEGVRLTSGDTLQADLLVLATGYEPQQDAVRQVLGGAIADRVGATWGLGPDGEMLNLCKPTAQPGLWFMAGTLSQCRVYSKYLALQLVAALDAPAAQSSRGGAASARLDQAAGAPAAV